MAGNYDVDALITNSSGYTLSDSTDAELTISGVSFSLSTTTASVSESGSTATFTVVLGAAPTTDVVLDMTVSDATEATVLPTFLTFTPANWNTAQTVTITGVDDVIVDGTVSSVVDDASSDNTYDPLANQSITVSTIDNDGNNPPVLSDVTVAIAESASLGATLLDINDAGSTTDSDADGNTITYSITAGNTGAAFAIDAATVVITTATLLDYETTWSYSHTVLGTDGSLSDTAIITVTVSDVDSKNESSVPTGFRLHV